MLILPFPFHVVSSLPHHSMPDSTVLLSMLTQQDLKNSATVHCFLLKIEKYRKRHKPQKID